MSNPSTVTHPSVSGGAIGLGGPSMPVGTNVGDIGLWEIGSRERLVLRNYKVWDLGACSMPLQAALVKDPGVSVNHVIWSPDGSLFAEVKSKDKGKKSDEIDEAFTVVLSQIRHSRWSSAKPHSECRLGCWHSRHCNS